MQLFIMPTLLRKFDPGFLYAFCMAIWPVSFLAMPLVNMVARDGVDEMTGIMDPNTTALLWSGIAFVMASSRVACLTFG
jgi:hypothetical protein